VKRSGLSLRTQLSLVRAVNNTVAPPKKSIEKKRVGRKPKSETKNNVTKLLYERSLLLVDGYNIIFGTEKLKEMSAKSLDQARESLVTGCESVAHARGWDVVVVFDATQTDDDRVEDHRSPRVTVVFTGRGETADAYIEKTAEERRDLGDGATLVATNDNMVRLMASARKASILNVDALMDAIEGSEKAMAARLKAGRAANELEKDYDILEVLAVRHTGAEIEAANVRKAQEWSDHRQLLDRIAADRSAADIERLASIEKHMPDEQRKSFDKDKMLLGLQDLLGTAWWGDTVIAEETSPARKPWRNLAEI
jgi:predicted RNA-binding protein with PIN domain